MNEVTLAQTRAAGWQAEARDRDGHVVWHHRPQMTDRDIAWFTHVATARGATVTIWPDQDTTVEAPGPTNRISTATNRAHGFQAEARDGAGHLTGTHVPFETDDDVVWFVRAFLERGHTVTIWPADPASFRSSDPFDTVGGDTVATRELA